MLACMTERKNNVRVVDFTFLQLRCFSRFPFYLRVKIRLGLYTRTACIIYLVDFVGGTLSVCLLPGVTGYVASTVARD